MNKMTLMSAVAVIAVATAFATEANAKTTCGTLSGKALEQRIAAGKCDGTVLSPEMRAALAMVEKAGKDWDEPTNEADKEPGHEPGDEPGDEASDEPNKGSGEDGSDQPGTKKVPGDKIVSKLPGGEINIPNKPVVKKQPADGQGGGHPDHPKDGDVVVFEKVDDLETGEPSKPKNGDPVVLEKVDDLALGEPEDDIKALAEPEDPVKGLVEPEDKIKTLAEPENPVKGLVEPEDVVKSLADPNDELALVDPAAPKKGKKTKVPAHKVVTAEEVIDLKVDPAKKSDAPLADDRNGQGRDKNGHDNGQGGNSKGGAAGGSAGSNAGGSAGGGENDGSKLK